MMLMLVDSSTVSVTSRSTEIYNGMTWSVTAPTIYVGMVLQVVEQVWELVKVEHINLVVVGFMVQSSEIFNSSVSSGSFGQLRGTVGGEIKTDMFNITSSTFKLPLFSDARFEL